MIIKTFVEGPIDANNYLLIDEKSNDAVLIDCSSSRDEFINAVKSLGVNLKYILLTHGHFDHILGVEKFNEIFHVNAYINEKDLEQVKLMPNMMQMFMTFASGNVPQIKHFVKDGDEFNIGEIKIKAISTPGHTEGGMSFLVGNKLFSGDTLFRASVGRCDLPGGSLNKIADSIKNKLFFLPDETEVYPGHGENTTIGFEKRYNEILNI